jgi:uncharacterized membrane protein
MTGARSAAISRPRSTSMANSGGPPSSPDPGTEGRPPDRAASGNLPEQLERVLTEARLPQPQLTRVRREIVSYLHTIETYAGPLPHPGHLERFERTLPGAADRIFNMAEQQQKHRHAWEMRELSASIVTERIGLFGGILVALGLIAGAVVCAWLGQRWVAVVLVAASAVSMVPAIIKGRDRPQQSEAQAPEPAMVPVAGPPRKRAAKNRRNRDRR